MLISIMRFLIRQHNWKWFVEPLNYSFTSCLSENLSKFKIRERCCLKVIMKMCAVFAHHALKIDVKSKSQCKSSITKIPKRGEARRFLGPTKRGEARHHSKFCHEAKRSDVGSHRGDAKRFHKNLPRFGLWYRCLSTCQIRSEYRLVVPHEREKRMKSDE